MRSYANIEPTPLYMRAIVGITSQLNFFQVGLFLERLAQPMPICYQPFASFVLFFTIYDKIGAVTVVFR